jgi:hypothetical protein
VNNDLRETLRRFKGTASNTDAALAVSEAREFIYRECDDLPEHKIKAALEVLDKVKEGGYISTFNEREDDIFAYTWARCSHPRNHGKEKLMREAVVNSLADGIENGNQVCINGRCGRVLNSFATIDFDKEISETGVMTFEAYKNQIFQETKTIIGDEINRAKASEDEKLREVGESYEDVSIKPDPVVEEQFKCEIKREIDNNIAKYENKLNEKEIDNIKQECYVYAVI